MTRSIVHVGSSEVKSNVPGDGCAWLQSKLEARSRSIWREGAQEKLPLNHSLDIVISTHTQVDLIQSRVKSKNRRLKKTFFPRLKYILVFPYYPSKEKQKVVDRTGPIDLEQCDFPGRTQVDWTNRQTENKNVIRKGHRQKRKEILGDKKGRLINICCKSTAQNCVHRENTSTHTHTHMFKMNTDSKRKVWLLLHNSFSTDTSYW